MYLDSIHQYQKIVLLFQLINHLYNSVYEKCFTS